MRRRSFTSPCVHAGVPTALAILLCNTSAYAEERSFNIPEQDAQRSLSEFARQADIEILAPTGKLKGIRFHAVHGTYDIREALKILVAGTGLDVVADDGDFITLGSRVDAKPNGINATDASKKSRTAKPKSTALSSGDDSDSDIIIITGSRIVRGGYQAPTPLTVIGTEIFEGSADANVVSLLATMPAITGSSTAGSSLLNLGPGTGAIQSLNLRSLGSNRVLVLLDGQRASPSTYGGVVDVSTFPSQLISRVDVVTGGASAVYGSDAVAGVVNFVLDKKFKGVKGEISAGLTNNGDDRNYKIDLAASFAFGPDDRGTVLISGEQLFNSGIKGDGNRSWDKRNELQMPNPNYSETNGQPQFLILQNGSLATATAGGLIVAGPLKGTAFGKGGAPYHFQFGSIISVPTMYGGDAATNSIKSIADLTPEQNTPRAFLRVSYDLTDNIKAFAQWGWSQNINRSISFPIWMPGNATSYVVHGDNPYIPNSVRNAMAANGATNFAIGSWNADMPPAVNGNSRLTNRMSGGLDGKFDAFDTSWTWDAYYSYGSTKMSLFTNVPVKALYLLAIDAVTDPRTGQIVCRSVLAGANNGCRPWNPLGIGVNDSNQGSYDWMLGGGAFQRGLIEQSTMAASVTGEPFSSWAGPVSIALSAEYRSDEIHSVADQYGTVGARFVGNYAPIDGSQSVTEGAMEAVVPLAKNETWASKWDVTLAARFTSYELAGYVTTYKVGTTYVPVDDVKLRLMRSHDIRAPNIQELFASPYAQVGTTAFDRFLGQQTPGSMISVIDGNTALKPEKSDTTGVGIVYSPDYLAHFFVSVDYWDVDIKGAIQNTTNQIIIDSCYTQRIPENCANITRGADGTITRILNLPINMATQDVKGIDVESSYSFELSRLASFGRGSVSLHGLMSFYLRNYTDTTFVPPTDSAGQNGGAAALPNWKYNVTATYELNPIRVSLTGRGFSSGKINAQYLECASRCPAATVATPTINYNYAPGTFYLDANIVYMFAVGDARTDVFASAKNFFNRAVPPIPSTYYYSNAQGAPMYDALGVVFRAGIRFKM